MPAFLLKEKKIKTKKKKEAENGMKKLFIYNGQNQSWQREDIKRFTPQSLLAQGKQSPFNRLFQCLCLGK